MKTANQTKTTRPAAILLAVVPSSSNPSVSYEVKRSQVDGVTYCSCPSWKFDMDGKKLVGYARPSSQRSCKHTRAVLNGLLTPPVAAQAAPVAPKAPAAPKAAVAAPKASQAPSTDLTAIRATAAYAIKKGQTIEAVLAILKEAGLSNLAAWSLLRELDA